MAGVEMVCYFLQVNQADANSPYWKSVILEQELLTGKV